MITAALGVLSVGGCKLGVNSQVTKFASIRCPFGDSRIYRYVDGSEWTNICVNAIHPPLLHYVPHDSSMLSPVRMEHI